MGALVGGGAPPPPPPTDPRGPLFLAGQPLPTLLLTTFFLFLILCSEPAPKDLVHRLLTEATDGLTFQLQEVNLRSFFSCSGRRLQYALFLFVWPFCL